MILDVYEIKRKLCGHIEERRLPPSHYPKFQNNFTTHIFFELTELFKPSALCYYYMWYTKFRFSWKRRLVSIVTLEMRQTVTYKKACLAKCYISEHWNLGCYQGKACLIYLQLNFIHYVRDRIMMNEDFFVFRGERAFKKI